MKFIIRNQAQIANKYLRFAKWKIRRLASKFDKILYSEIFVKKITHSPDLYAVTIKLGQPGPDIVVSAKANNLNELWSTLSRKMKRKLVKGNKRRKMGATTINNYISMTP